MTTAVRNSGGTPPSPVRSSLGSTRGGRKAVTSWFIAPTAMSHAGSSATRTTSGHAARAGAPASQRTAASATAVPAAMPPTKATFGCRSTQRWSRSFSRGR